MFVSKRFEGVSRREESEPAELDAAVSDLGAFFDDLSAKYLVGDRPELAQIALPDPNRKRKPRQKKSPAAATDPNPEDSQSRSKPSAKRKTKPGN